MIAVIIENIKADKQKVDAAPVFLWSAIEVSIGIMAAGIIELSPLMRKLNVKGFEDSFDQLDEDQKPIILKNMKSDIGPPSLYGIPAQR